MLFLFYNLGGRSQEFSVLNYILYKYSDTPKDRTYYYRYEYRHWLCLIVKIHQIGMIQFEFNGFFSVKVLHVELELLGCGCSIMKNGQRVCDIITVL